MCNLYSITKAQDAIRELFRIRHDRTGNLPPMPVILTTEAKHGVWLSAPVEEVMNLQRPLPNGALQIFARGERKDAA